MPSNTNTTTTWRSLGRLDTEWLTPNELDVILAHLEDTTQPIPADAHPSLPDAVIILNDLREVFRYDKWAAMTEKDRDRLRYWVADDMVRLGLARTRRGYVAQRLVDAIYAALDREVAR